MVVLVLLFPTAMQAQNFVGTDTAKIAKQQQLDAVVVKAERPLVKVKTDGGMLYEASQLAKNKPIANAYDLLDEIPGVVKGEESVGIIGVDKTTVIINGRKRQMSQAEMVSYLSAMSQAQVKSIEVYYDAPPQFGVKGGVINIQLQQKRSEKLSANGSVFTSLYQGSKYFQTGGFNLNLFQKKWMWDNGFSLGNLRANKKLVLYSQHTIDGTLYDVENCTKRYVRSDAFKITSRFNYDLSKNSKLELSYVYRDDSPDYDAYSPLSIDGKLVSDAMSQFGHSKHSHTFEANLTGKSWNVGGNFVLFKENGSQDMSDAEGKSPVLSSLASQDTKAGEVYANHTLKLGKGQLRYGLDLEWTRSANSYSNHWIANIDKPDEGKDNVLREQIYDGFVGWVQKLSKFNFSANMTVNYYKSTLEQGGEKATQWDGFVFLPNLSATYKASKMNSWVFSFSADRIYPSFSLTSGRKAYYNTYQYDEYNPEIKPYYTYNFHLNYVMRNKYIVGLYSTLTPHRYGQVMYQDHDVLEAGSLYFSYDRNSSYGLMVVVPHNWSSKFVSRLTAYGSCHQLKGTFRDITFDRDKLVGKVVLKNDAVLDKRKTLSLQLLASYNTAFISDYADMAAQFNSSLAMAWNPYKTNWSFVLKATDLFDTMHPKRTVNWGLQHYTYKQYNDTRRLNLTIRYSFKGYKNKQLKEVDISRMGL